MEPTLTDGQGLLAIRSGRAVVGQLRCVQHPDRPGFWLVKRVDEVLGDGTMSVRSDNRSVEATDSGAFGPVPVEGSYRVIARVPRRWM
jgi:hypothetical protein